MPDILHHRVIAASPERVFEALTTQAGVRGWWTRDATLDASVGEFGFHARKVVTMVRVDEAKPVRVRWTTLQSNAPGGWNGTTISFELTPVDDGTVLDFAHRGFAELNDGVERVTVGWGVYLDSLKALAETGVGAPHGG